MAFAPEFPRAAPRFLALDAREYALLEPPRGAGRDRHRLRALVARACQRPLVPAQQRFILLALAGRPDAVVRCGLAPLGLPRLVENNPGIAGECLLRLARSPRMPEYLAALGAMDVSLHAMEVVSRLATGGDPPPEFVGAYVSKCISACETMQDAYAQNRMVRLVCVFLQSLIRNGIINGHDLSTELQAFCVEFSRIREAAVLFRLLKTA